jgi:pilus assembly protein Flp/PilA
VEREDRCHARDEIGASAVEYGLLVAAIAAAIAVVVFNMGGMVVNAFTGTCDEVKSKIPSPSTCS